MGLLDNPEYAIPFVGPVLAAGDATGINARDLAQRDTHRKLSQVFRENGWPDSAIKTAVQIAVAESNGNPKAKGDGGLLGCKGKPTSIGFMQVRGFDNKCQPVHAGKAGSPVDYDAFVKWAQDPDNNVRLALAIYKEAGNSFNPWTVYKTGRYKLSGNRDPLVTTKQTFGVDDIPVVGEAIGAAESAVNIMGDFVSLITSRDTWFRIGKGIVGLELITLGFVGLAIVALKDPINTVLGGTAKRASRVAKETVKVAT